MEKPNNQEIQELENLGIKDNPELKRIYNAIYEDLSKWDKEKPIGEYVVEIIEKRLFVSKEEARKIAEDIFKGIIEYKEAKEYLKNNPELLKEIKKDKNITILEKVLNPLENLITSLKRKLNKEVKNDENQ